MGENSVVKLVEELEESKSSIEPILENIVDINDIPEVSDDILENYDNRAVYFESSRGCMYRCSYCLSSIDKTSMYFDMNRVKRELKKLLDKNVIQIRFIDRTFNSNKERTMEIWKYLVENRRDTTFHFEINARTLTEEMFCFLENIPKNIFHLEIGIQSTNKETLEEINRGDFWTIEKKNIKRLIEHNNVLIHTDLIVGLPYETYNIFKISFCEVYMLYADELQLGFLKLIYGTKIRNEMSKHGYTCLSYPTYEVLSNKYISYREIMSLKDIEDSLNTYYNSGKFKNSIRYIEDCFSDNRKNVFEMYEYISTYLRSNGYLDRKISIQESYDILFSMFEGSKYIENDDLFREILKFDFVKNFNGRREWMLEHSTNFKGSINTCIKGSKCFENKLRDKIMKEYKFEEFSVDILDIRDIILNDEFSKCMTYNDKVIIYLKK